MNKFLFTLLLSSSISYAQYAIPPRIGNLSEATITIPIQNWEEIGPLSSCKISLNHRLGLRAIVNKYITNRELLDMHIHSCLKAKNPLIRLEYVPITIFGWAVNFKFSFARTNYLNTDLHVQGSELNGTISNFNFLERTSADFYNPGNWRNVQNAFQWIDEPTNYFTLSFVKNKNNIIISLFHPKWLIGDNSNNRVSGNLNGKDIDTYMNVDEPLEDDYSNYNTAAGELHLVRFENTHLQMEFSLGYGRDLTLFSSKRGHQLVFQPAIYAGFLTGANYTLTRDHGDFWNFSEYKSPFQLQGPMVGFGVQIKYDFGLFDLFYQTRYSAAAIRERGAWGGEINYTHQYITNTAGLGIDLVRPRRVRRRNPKF